MTTFNKCFRNAWIEVATINHSQRYDICIYKSTDTLGNQQIICDIITRPSEQLRRY